MRPDGSHAHYDKRHLFSLAKEQDTYTAGTRKLIVTLGEWTICPQVCYDLRFPVWSRNAEEYDLLLNVANWPEKRSQAWRTLLRARAIENQCYVVAVNRVGNDGNDVYHSGDSAVIDPMGETVWERSHDEAVETVTISRQVIYETRRKFPFLADRDDFEVRV
jgi:predicted amidohydrolase